MDSILAYPCSYIGRRKNNEDFYYVPKEGSQFKLYAVADGMGGANAGEVASKLAIRTITTFLEAELKPDFLYTDDVISEILRRGFHKIQIAIADAVKANLSYSGMGTTLVLLLYIKEKWYAANLGDSRLYRIGMQKTEQLTKDHSLLQEYLDSHDQPPDQEWLKKYSSYIVKALDGTNSTPDVFILDEGIKEPYDDSCFLLCSDGLLTGKGSGDELPYAMIIKESENIRDAAEQLVCHAFHKGSSDNITVVLIEPSNFKHSSSRTKKYPFPPVSIPQLVSIKAVRKRSLVPVFILILAIVICLSAILYFFSGVPVNPAKFHNSTNIGKMANFESIENDKAQIEKWQAFMEIDYYLPMKKNSIIKWTAYPANKKSCKYNLVIWENNTPVDSIQTKETSCILGKFQHIKPRKEYKIFIQAILPGNTVVPSTNNVLIKYQ